MFELKSSINYFFYIVEKMFLYISESLDIYIYIYIYEI